MVPARYNDEAAAAAASADAAAWLHTLDGDAPLLLIAPHGGQAGPATHALLHPKVNDLHTADITRELAARLDAGAIVNAGMDRNLLDLNRLSQVMGDAPWMLELIAARLERIVTRRGRAVVLLVHGWNVIEPRVDLGVGLRPAGGALRPARGGHVSASDAFINGPLLDFAERLRASGIIPSFGLRYPGAGANNLLQAFTQRHAQSPVGALRRLAALNARGALEAVQLELSVALRLPGRLRAQTLDAIAHSFARAGHHAAAPRAARIAVVRAAEANPPAPAARRAAVPAAAPIRVGLEFYDPAAEVGAMASFDIGPAAAGARVMALLERGQVALFTAEGRVERGAHALELGPLRLSAESGRLVFEFRGPAVVVGDGAEYLSIERALAGAALHEAMELRVEFEPWPPPSAPAGPHAETLLDHLAHPERGADAVFGRVAGHFTAAGRRRSLDAVARAGRSFSGVGARGFRTRRMLWAVFRDGGAPLALEARALLDDDGTESLTARVLDDGRWAELMAGRLELEPAAPQRPQRIAAMLGAAGGGGALAVGGQVRNFVMLSRPGPAQSRILTSLGFATFSLGGRPGAGMFECSRRHAEAPPQATDADEADND